MPDRMHVIRREFNERLERKVEAFSREQANLQAASLAALVAAVRAGRAGAVTPRAIATPRYGKKGTHGKHCAYSVRGHWRLIPCGPQRAKRRRMWINPFDAGDADLVPSLATLYRRRQGRS